MLQTGYREPVRASRQRAAEQTAAVHGVERLSEIGQNVAFVAHELRNPLQNVQMGLDVLRLHLKVAPGIEEIIEDMDYSVATLKAVVNELLDYTGPAPLCYELFPLRRLVDQALGMVTAQLYDVTLHLGEELQDVQIPLDVEKMVRVFVNLITNAVEAMPHGGELSITAEMPDDDDADHLILRISDTGCGISKQDIERIQQPFITTKPRGIGLGIPICRKIVEEHNGSLHIRSEPEKGTTVEIMLPVSRIAAGQGAGAWDRQPCGSPTW